MGTGVYPTRVSSSISGCVRAYAHSTPGPAGTPHRSPSATTQVSLALTNGCVAPQQVHVTVHGPTGYITTAGASGALWVAMVWALGARDLASDFVQLNGGADLRVNSKGGLPRLNGTRTHGTGTPLVTLPSQSAVFVHITIRQQYQ